MVPGPPSTGVAIAMDGGMADTACYFLFHDLRIRRVQHNAVDCLIQREINKKVQDSRHPSGTPAHWPANCNAQRNTYEPSRVGRCMRVPACVALCLRGSLRRHTPPPGGVTL